MQAFFLNRATKSAQLVGPGGEQTDYTYQNFIHCRNSSCKPIESLYHWVIQIGREARVSLAQPDGPRKHNCESTVCCTRLYPPESLKPPRIENVWLILANISTASGYETGFLCLQAWFHLYLFFLILQSCTTEEPGSISPVTSLQALPD